MDTCSIEVDKNEKYLSANVSRDTENTSDKYKNKDIEYENISNSIFNLYNCGKNICQ